jgi:NAD+ synthase (glutamine-hydrolysing)
MRIALAQINTTIGDYAGNLTRMRAAIERARGAGADLVAFPELGLCGYPPLDLLQRPSFLADHERAVAELASAARGIAVVSGALRALPGARPKALENSMLAFVDGALAFEQAKTLLPTYDVFDEARYFQPAGLRRPWTFAGRRIGFAICEDVWSGEFWGPNRPYPIDPVAEQVAAGAEMILTVSASPWEQGKIQLREAMMSDAAQRHRVPFLFVNLVGGNDELVFDGSSCAIDRQGRVVWRGKSFDEDFAVLDPFADGRAQAPPPPDDAELLERALVLGVRDYLHKLGMRQAVIGLSGGIDSAVTAHVASLALGADNVLGVLMPGPYSSEHSVTDAQALAHHLGIETRTARIDSIFKAFLSEYAGLLGSAANYGLTQENLQARIRGTLLMSVSNREGRIVLATGNKSELSVGYTTLYGDLVGGLAVIGDVLKRDVYRLARHANRAGPRIPESSLRKPPSAELAPGQLDTDSLPPYEVLDAILEQVIERGLAAEQIVPPAGADAGTVRWVLAQIDKNEYKRRQAPVVLRVSGKAFGSGRRLPIVHRSGWGV